MYPSSTSSSEPRRRAADEDTLIGVPDELAVAPPRRRAAAWAVVVFFFAALALTGLVDTLFPAPRPRLRGVEAAEDAKMRREAHLLDGSLARLLEHDLRLTSRVRRNLASYYTLILFRYLDEAQGRAIVGPGGWLFLHGRTVLKERSDAAQLGWTTAMLAAVERRLASLGIRFVLVPVPRKSALYGEYLPRGIDARPDLDKRLPGRLARRGIAAVDLWSVFRHARKETPEDLLYYQTDSHWTETAQLLAAREIAGYLGLSDPDTPQRSRLVEGLDDQERDSLDFIGLAGIPSSAFAFLNQKPVKTYDVVFEGEEGFPEPPQIVVTGTSFTAQRKLVAYLEHFTQHSVRNAAKAATHPLESLATFLDEPRESPPTTVILEIPEHSIFGFNPLAYAAELFAGTTPGQGVPALKLRRFILRQKLRRDLDLRGRLILGRLPGGSVLQSGDGVVAVRIRGSFDGDVDLVVNHAGHELKTPWPAGRREVLLPVVAAAATGSRVRLEARGKGHLKLEAAEAVALLDESDAVLGQHTRPRSREGGWIQVVRFPDAPEVKRHAALVLDFAGRGIKGSVEVALKAEETPDEPLRFTLGPVAEKGVVVLSLTPLHGRRLTTVEVRGTGPAPAAWIRRGRILGVSVPSTDSQN